MGSTTSIFGGAAITNLNGLSDVAVSGEVARHRLSFNGTNWVNGTLPLDVAPIGHFVRGSGTVSVAATDVWDATDKIPYRVLTGGDAAQELWWGAIFRVPDGSPIFRAVGATIEYKLSVGAPNKVELVVTGTDGVDGFTSSAGQSTSKATLQATLANLAPVVKTSGGLIAVAAKCTLDNTVTASLGPIQLLME